MHQSQTEVLVVGAGPVGLWTALVLAEKGLEVIVIDRELGDMIPKRVNPITGDVIPLEEDCGRHFLYARFNPDLSRAGLDTLHLGAINPAEVEAMDGVANIRQMQDVGRAYASECVEMAPFKSFL